MPCGLRRESQETAQNKAASTKVKGTAEKTQHDAPFKYLAGPWGTETPSQASTVLSPSSLQLGPEQSAALRWRGSEKSREHPDHSSLPQCRLLDLSGTELGGENS